MLAKLVCRAVFWCRDSTRGFDEHTCPFMRVSYTPSRFPVLGTVRGLMTKAPGPFACNAWHLPSAQAVATKSRLAFNFAAMLKDESDCTCFQQAAPNQLNSPIYCCASVGSQVMLRRASRYSILTTLQCVQNCRVPYDVDLCT